MVLGHPVSDPGFCIRCGSQNRDWFVDLGIDAAINIPPDGDYPVAWLDGILYYCCECINNLLTDVEAALKAFAASNKTTVPFIFSSNVEELEENADAVGSGYIEVDGNDGVDDGVSEGDADESSISEHDSSNFFGENYEPDTA